MIIERTRDRSSNARSGDRHELLWVVTGEPAANPSSSGSVVKLI
jgi:hypothetical protein